MDNNGNSTVSIKTGAEGHKVDPRLEGLTFSDEAVCVNILNNLINDEEKKAWADADAAGKQALLDKWLKEEATELVVDTMDCGFHNEVKEDIEKHLSADEKATFSALPNRVKNFRIKMAIDAKKRAAADAEAAKKNQKLILTDHTATARAEETEKKVAKGYDIPKWAAWTAGAVCVASITAAIILGVMYVKAKKNAGGDTVVEA